MADTTIRPLKGTDWDAFWALRLRALAEHPDAFGQDLDEALAAGEQPARERFAPLANDPRSVIFGAFDAEHALVGAAGVVGNDRRKMRHRAFIWGVYVATEARGAGIGRRLIETCVAHAREVPRVRQVHLTVASHSASAVALYERCGFSRYGREPRALILADGREIDEDLMVLMLDR